jgi:hypothetical protein
MPLHVLGALTSPRISSGTGIRLIFGDKKQSKIVILDGFSFIFDGFHLPKINHKK